MLLALKGTVYKWCLVLQQAPKTVPITSPSSLGTKFVSQKNQHMKDSNNVWDAK